MNGNEDNLRSPLNFFCSITWDAQYGAGDFKYFYSAFLDIFFVEFAEKEGHVINDVIKAISSQANV